jgi:hypothetical protein
MRLSDLTSETRELAVPYKEKPDEYIVKLVYRTHVITPGFMREIQELDGVDRLVYQIKKIIVSWDVTDDDLKPIPITDEGLAEVPTQLMLWILDQIAQDRYVLSDESKNG